MLCAGAAPVRPFDHVRIAGSRCAQSGRVWHDTDPPQIQPIGIPTGLHRNIAFNAAMRVVGTGISEQLEFPIGQKDMCAPQGFGKTCSARTMFAVIAIVLAAGVVQKSKQLDHFLVGAGLAGQLDSNVAHPRPVADAMNAVPI